MAREKHQKEDRTAAAHNHWAQDIREIASLDRTDDEIAKTALAFLLQSLREDPNCLNKFKWSEC